MDVGQSTTGHKVNVVLMIMLSYNVKTIASIILTRIIVVVVIMLEERHIADTEGLTGFTAGQEAYLQHMVS